MYNGNTNLVSKPKHCHGLDKILTLILEKQTLHDCCHFDFVLKKN